MSLAIWLDFWNWDGAPQSLSATVVPLSPLVTGTARGKSTPNNTYQMLPDDYWDEREARITGKDIPKADPSLPQEKATSAPPPSPKPDTERASLLDAMRNASSLDELKSISAQLKG